MTIDRLSHCWICPSRHVLAVDVTGFEFSGGGYCVHRPFAQSSVDGCFKSQIIFCKRVIHAASCFRAATIVIVILIVVTIRMAIVTIVITATICNVVLIVAIVVVFVLVLVVVLCLWLLWYADSACSGCCCRCCCFRCCCCFKEYQDGDCAPVIMLPSGDRSATP